MSKHTTGPWKLLPYDKVDIHEGYEIIDANGTPIASVRSELYFESPEQLEATARLMVMAPELLEMLKRAWKALEAGGYPYSATIHKTIARLEG